MDFLKSEEEGAAAPALGWERVRLPESRWRRFRELAMENGGAAITLFGHELWYLSAAAQHLLQTSWKWQDVYGKAG